MDDIYRSQFRIPYSLYELLKEAAEANHRSVNAELVARLEQTFAFERSRDERNEGESILDSQIRTALELLDEVAKK